jgi:hypothetical protein
MLYALSDCNFFYLSLGLASNKNQRRVVITAMSSFVPNSITGGNFGDFFVYKRPASDLSSRSFWKIFFSQIMF